MATCKIVFEDMSDGKSVHGRIELDDETRELGERCVSRGLDLPAPPCCQHASNLLEWWEKNVKAIPDN